MERADAVTDGPEVKVGTSEDKQLELLLILEEGDELFDVTNSREKGRTVLRVKSAEEAQDDASGSAGSSRKQSHEKMERDALDVQANEKKGVILEHRPEEECEVSVKMDGLSDGKGETAETEKITHGETADLCGDAAAEVKLRPKDRLSPHDAKHTAHRLSPDWPDALCELLFALQEGRRLNDQRCSFQLEPRRRCYSEPGTPRHSQRVHFSSMTSLQKEEFFDLLVTSQGRRLDDQRAELQNVPSAPPAPAPVKAKPRRSSWKVTEVVRKIPTQKPQEDFYNMIVCTQAQGRLEEQRSAAPGPMDDEDFFSLLLKVQGGRMEEQRTEMKPVPQLL